MDQLRLYWRRTRFFWWRLRACKPKDVLGVVQTLLRIRPKDIQMRLAQRLSTSKVTTVRSGPFAGMKILVEPVSLSLTSKIIGSYESELHDVLATLPGRCYDTVLDLGCAEGYYAVGLALLLKPKRVIAVDIERHAISVTHENARLNGISCPILTCMSSTHDLIRSACIGHTLIVCDIEGTEAALLDPEICPSLVFVDMLVEIHDAPDSSSILDLMINRFKRSHVIQIIKTAPRDPSIWHMCAKEFSESELGLALDEMRPHQMSWIIALKND